MNADVRADSADSRQTKVYMTEDGRAVIEQSKDAVVVLTSEQILTVIKELHVCYDYCAAWKQPQ
ncbi:hypothetical protein JM946_08335 [Steroidobacter sp. S1-65]|uniref:MarR family transcriptional regulator n=1 Tax=Steroidobacter gossypii TaxID=2805490 RepID=A0ABS1WUV8_9GAMM|nr:hypothetical protein [Steroidobacter gossypii]MBM0104752.1 hypothetical protein [Steroidobacter gossypii]